MMDYHKELPEHISMSQYLRERADGFFSFPLNGLEYYVPLTKEMKKLFKIKRNRDKLVFPNFTTSSRFEDMIQVIASSLYLQTRNTVGVEIREEVVRIVQNKIENLLTPVVDKEIETRFEAKDKLLGEGNNE